METLVGKRIAVVEDNVINLAVFATTLRQQGVTVIQDAWSTDTIELLARNLPIDLIVLDIMLRHGVSGYDIFDEIKKHPKLGHIPVVAVSSLDPESEIPKAKAKGFTGFISKPISHVEFPQHILAAMNGEKVWVFSR
jgi:CheY-like chemotaxis protein